MKPRWVLASAAGALALTGWLACPRPDLYGATPWSEAVYDTNGRLVSLRPAADGQYRLQAVPGSLPPAVEEALLLYEDRHFRRHAGINPLSVIRAAWITYVTRERTIGGSTLTMQLARMRYDLNTTGVAGKLRQMGLALAFERHYVKDEILAAWLDLAPFGGNVHGIETAAVIYFGKPVAELSVTEALTLVVVPQNPTGRNPATDRGHRAMLAARDRLAARWLARHEDDAALRPLLALPLAIRSPRALPDPAPHYTRDALAGRPRAQRHHVGLDITLQTTLTGVLRRYVDGRRAEGIDNAAALLIDHRSMTVLAEIGSAAFLDARIAGQVNGTRARRSPGSTLKPFIYALAMDDGLIHPMSLLGDAPIRYRAYTPENFDRGFSGPVLARDALVYSRNVPAVSLLARMGTERFHRLLDDAGIAGLERPDHYGLALALGGVEVSMRELVMLYGALANGGVLRPLSDRPGGDPDATGVPLISPESAFLVLDMLSASARPTATDLVPQGGQPRVAWKTGTSYAYRDAWTVGVAGQYVLAVWVGNFDGTGNPAFVGRKAAAPLFFRLLGALAPSLEPRAGPQPEPDPGLRVKRVDICAPTGDLPGPYCPATAKGWFIPGVSPIRVSDVHRVVRIDSASGLRVCDRAHPNARQEIYEFWPSDIERVLRQAGIAVRSPPPPGPGCTGGHLAAGGNPPRIASPDATLVYRRRPVDAGVPLSAVTDADATAIYWYVDDRYVGRSATDAVLHWRGEAGRFTVTAVDDMGRAATSGLTVLPVAGYAGRGT